MNTPLPQKQLNKLSGAELKALASRGILQVMTTTEDGKFPMCIEDTPEFALFKKLKGKGIGIAEAGRKYNVPSATMSHWKTKGFLKVIGRKGQQKILVDEQYAAYCAYVFHQSAGQGKWAFNKNGTPRTQGTDLRS